MTLENVQAGTMQIELPLMLLNLLWKYAVMFILKKLIVEVKAIKLAYVVMLILQKLSVLVWMTTVYQAVCFDPHSLWLIMCCHLCKPTKLLLKMISIR